ncbi:MAG: glycosyltransferase family 4 protein [Anaerolineales bacterium]
MNAIKAIHQIAPVFAYGDAIGNQMFQIRERLRRWGIPSQVYAGGRDARLEDPGVDFRTYPGDPAQVLIYHYSTQSSLTEFVRRLPDQTVLYYHNVTPPDFYAPYDAEFAEKLRRGREEVARFKDDPVAWAGSPFNRRDLLALGFSRVDVVPYFLNFENLLQAGETSEAQRIVARYTSGDDAWVNWLFVGRLAPNKRQDDIIRAFSYYHRVINPRSRLFLVGSDGGLPAYRFELEVLAARTVPDHIYLPGAVSFEALAGYYRAASVFVSMSEHEGFGIPLIEAMNFDLPVVAFKAAAVPDTMGEAGVLVSAKRHAIIAEMVDRLMRDEVLRRKIIQKQRERVEQFAPQVAEMALRKAVQDLKSQPGG